MNLDLGTLKNLLGRLRFLANALLIVGIFLIICAGLGVVYLEQQREQDSLNSQIASTSVALQSPPYNITTLEEQRDQERADLEELIDSFSDELIGSNIAAVILQIAETNNVTITTPVTLNSATETKIGNHTYLVLRFNTTAQGSSDNLQNFIRSLESQSEELKTLVFESATIEPLAPTDDKYSASLGFCLYAHPHTE